MRPGVSARRRRPQHFPLTGVAGGEETEVLRSSRFPAPGRRPWNGEEVDMAERKWIGLVVGLALAGPGATQAQSLTTTFADGLWGDADGGIYFDLQNVGGSPVEVTSFDVNLSAGGTWDVSVWYRSGSSAGFEQTNVGWTLLGTASGVSSLGADVPTPLPVGGLTLDPGETFGIAMSLVPTNAVVHGWRYSDGANVYADSHLSISTGSANHPAFSGSVNSPRTWNGTIYYRVTSVLEIPTLGEVGLVLMVLTLSAGAFLQLRRRRSTG
jgi:hypothetical protein